MGRLLAFVIAATFIYFRFTLPAEGVIHTEDLFKDAAHLVVASFLAIGFWGVTKTDSCYEHLHHRYGLGDPAPVYTWLWNRNWYPLIIGIVMTILEVVAFKLSQK
jgi:hypothetical protein